MSSKHFIVKKKHIQMIQAGMYKQNLMVMNTQLFTHHEMIKALKGMYKQTFSHQEIIQALMVIPKHSHIMR